MQFTSKFSYLASTLLACLTVHVVDAAVAIPTDVFRRVTVDTAVASPAIPTDVFHRVTVEFNGPTSIVVSEQDITNWIATTDANLTFIGEPITTISKRAQNVIVAYCTNRVNGACGGPCTVYNGPAICLDAPGTNCLAATANVGFCDRGGCGGSCNSYATCGTSLDNGFCYTPGTNSILVPFVP
ncbi:hypothetical protein BDN72DRAFT_838207 [Pluteus cervinus]|uniref:Uncharacterized protein n=1 Tax=Pluteus cervinus TaxID=181527 RepID=A0ACD3AZQ1_9AGAR|nr:hypothetical protein BDN72DRAFT_838207 [Pluteus cervinus]